MEYKHCVNEIPFHFLIFTVADRWLAGRKVRKTVRRFQTSSDLSAKAVPAKHIATREGIEPQQNENEEDDFGYNPDRSEPSE